MVHVAGRLFEAGCLLTFSAFTMGAYSRWALIRGWVLIRINMVYPGYRPHPFSSNNLLRALHCSPWSAVPSSS